MSYESYCIGLRMIEAHGYDTLRPCRTRADYELARQTLASLQSAVIGAGSNTWREAKERCRRATHIFRQLPTPCEVVLYNPTRCNNVGQGGACEKCSKTVINVMHRTCANYGIALD